jgi:hypothetical protein
VTVAARVVTTQSQPSLTLSRLAPIGLVVGESSCAPSLPNPSRTARILPPRLPPSQSLPSSLISHRVFLRWLRFQARLLPVVLAFVVALRLSPASMRATTTTQRTTTSAAPPPPPPPPSPPSPPSALTRDVVFGVGGRGRGGHSRGWWWDSELAGLAGG